MSTYQIIKCSFHSYRLYFLVLYILGTTDQGKYMEFFFLTLAYITEHIGFQLHLFRSKEKILFFIAE